MHLIEQINLMFKKSQGTFILCDKHLKEMEENAIPNITRIRRIHNGFGGECQICCEGEISPIKFETSPETINLLVTLADGSEELGWSASGRIGEFDYVIDQEENIYNTRESLYRRGVRRIDITTSFELHIDKPE